MRQHETHTHCNGLVDEGNQENDFDGDGKAIDEGDCNDLDALISPTAIEVCNGIDDNCDDVIDEGDPQLGQPCFADAVGACKNGTFYCDAEAKALRCQPSVSAPEICNAEDDNCDGTVDENNPEGGAPCDTGLQGACAAGVVTCVGGSPSCVALLVSVPETCNGIDDNCNGQIDDDVPGDGSSCVLPGELGVCKEGTVTCVAGSSECVASFTAMPETCNGLDDDCNGKIDDENPEGGATCDTGLLGACADGVVTCAGGSLPCVPVKSQVPESCNGLDDDCDGLIDEDVPANGASCSIAGQLGVCKQGTINCVAGVSACVPSFVPSAELCNGLDDNCNGSVDEGDPDAGTACDTGKLGACAAGTTHCNGGSVACVQNVQPAAGEVCNGIDDDCDGSVDEAPAGAGAACNVANAKGACAAGTMQCSGGALSCAQTVSAVSEICNGSIDDDCDGITDEGCDCLPGQTQPCGTNTGECVAGVQTCTAAGQWSATCQGEVVPKTEICNNKDDNCDGSTDDGNPGGGAPCNVAGAKGICKQGIMLCQGGSLACVSGITPQTETCNGLDDDCDGVVDDGNPGAGGACSVPGGLGACATGTLACQGGALQCVGKQAQAETCNGVDDDCDGFVDDVAGGAFKIPFPPNLVCNGQWQSFSAGSLPCGNYAGIPVVTTYPSADNDLAYSVTWSLGVSPTVNVNCHSAGGPFGGYLAVVAVPSSSVGSFQSSFFSLNTTATCDSETVNYPSVLNTASYPQFARFPAIRKVWLPQGDHNDDSQWYVGVGTSSAQIWFNGDGGGDILEGSVWQLGYKQDRINDATSCLASTGTEVVTVPKPGFPDDSLKYLPLFSVSSFRDDVTTCDDALACVGNTDDEHGYDVTITGEDDPSEPSVTFSIWRGTEGSNRLRYHAVVLAYE